MADPLVLPLSACTDRSLAGGKAAGLAALIRHKFHVPGGLCLTTAAYDAMVREASLDVPLIWRQAMEAPREERSRLLKEVETSILKTDMPAATASALDRALDQLAVSPDCLWAVRSSATNEDEITHSLAGHYDTALGVSRRELSRAIVEQWASLWKGKSVDSIPRTFRADVMPKMAVIVQPMIDARSAGVVFSAHPVTKRADIVVVNAVPGLGAPLVAGEVTPDEFFVKHDDSTGAFEIAHRRIAEKTRALRVTSQGVTMTPVVGEPVAAPVLVEAQIVELARLAKDVERAFGCPVDIEWAFDDQEVWMLQSRFITNVDSELTEDASDWSRANFKETLPELPSPAALSFLQEYMEHNLLRNYRSLGCHIPSGLSSVRIVRGRPFINVTLFQSLMSQLGGDPALVMEQMGGQGAAAVPMPKRLSPGRLLRAGLLIWWRMRQAVRHAPAWFEEMKRMADAPAEGEAATDSIAHLLTINEEFGLRLRRQDPTFAIAAGVGQGLQVLGTLMSRWFPENWRALLNAALQGQGTVISAKQILWLADLAQLAGKEAVAREFFLSEPWEPEGFRLILSGSAFLREWDRFMEVYGQRAVGESDIMVPRHAERPDSLLAVVRVHLKSDGSLSSRETIVRQESARFAALAHIRQALRRRPLSWVLFQWWHRRLCRFLQLREANRHHLMYFLVAVRRGLRGIGVVLADEGKLAVSDDIFYLTVHEIRSIASRPEKDWRELVVARKAERMRNDARPVPDFLPAGIPEEGSEPADLAANEPLRGIPISSGMAEGPVCVVRTTEDLQKVRRGVILVLPVLDPGLTPYFGFASGVVAEMGGTLSHGAIIAREYGLPAVANVARVTRVLHDGDRIVLDASSGTIRRVE